MGPDETIRRSPSFWLLGAARSRVAIRDNAPNSSILRPPKGS